ncbi:NAD(P)H-dependent FMN reductase [Nocardioides sp. YR527]|uniref:NADPH-dependent FMN reductase n=1 Tax=Nocardioides sp. YR527 TaxID=1881028 RepID=UPI0008877DDA|nr:NAD(P)H-dependent oxidoreductase [Nocardioides sp. YR527]SDL29682.1 NAD(P)H-dependent FMN reductase [Nocardioides sp. YR527]
MTQPLRIAVILASVREGRGGPIFGSWMAEQAEAYGGLQVELIDLADHEIPLSLPAESPKAAGDDYPRPEGQADLTDALAAAEGFIIVTPEYNHSYPASLKSALDWHFTQWQAKPVALVSYGGDSGGRHAALHLENVLTELHAHPLQARLAFSRYWEHLDENGRPNDPESAVYAKGMLAQLTWWAEALRAARGDAPYPG